MRFFLIIFTSFFIVIMLMGCTVSPGHNFDGALNKKQVLKINQDVDFFKFEGKVYKSLDGLEEIELTKGEQIGEISEGMANNIPNGAKIFIPKERRDILIVEYDGKEKRYLVQLGE